MLATKLLAACAGGVETLYSNDVFSAFTYTGTNTTIAVTNNINLSSKGGLIWTKDRSTAQGNRLNDTARGLQYHLISDSTAAQTNEGAIASVTSTGYTTSASNLAEINRSPDNYVSWTFRKAAKFFDIVTYTGNGANRTIAHSLGVVPGMIMVKRTDVAGSWMVYHNSIANTENLVLNTTAAKATNATAWNSTTATASVFSLGTHADVNTNTGTYVAYLFAHDASADGIVQCGTYVTDVSGNATISLGWEPQYLMFKPRSLGAWEIVDTARGWLSGVDNDNGLRANTSGAELLAQNFGEPTATGFSFTGYTANITQIYIAIRRPNKPPTLGTQVYNAIARTGTGAAATVTGVGFAPDLHMVHSRSGTTGGRWIDRLRGAKQELVVETTAAEAEVAQSVISFGMDGDSLGTDGDWNTNTYTYINWFFKRAPGVFDEVCDTGTGAAHTVSHNLTVAPELMIRKGRSAATQWEVWHGAIANTEKLVLNSTAAKATDTTAWNSTSPTSTVFTVGTGANVNTNAATYVTYLFATLAGISKCFSYTGNGGTVNNAGTSQTINCGFTTGARFVLIKCSSNTSDWALIDTVRGIIAGNDPVISLNTTAAEVTTTDLIDADSTGFIVNQLASGTTSANFNVTGYVYVGIAIA